ncbi:DUF4280 domain-containing protein [Chryseobacterium sp.]|jgi:hypothetical protein|uniref:DUF4280 domain-containing protein n=1 Tax=Chryseobacterium sp. TaxID=1871047 RepID=UPI002845FF90|nr:DUF4280 domain-containing protein [Chryseobacterium sp.]MDR3025137.1 DUF4280 domain-containing protein [Chryseobacterium sp.]
MSNEHENKYFIIQKGKAVCDKGTKFPNFKVNSHHKHYWNDEDGASDYLAVTEDDIQFNPPAIPFGNCSIKNGQPCSFAPVEKWNKPYEKVKVMGKSCLTEISELQCAIGGKIKVLEHGQKEELSKQNFKNVNPQIHNQINPLVDLEEFIENLEGDDFYF